MCTHIRRPLHTIEAIAMHHRNVYPYQTATSHNWSDCHASPQCEPISDGHFTQLKRLPCITAMCTHIRRPLHTIESIAMQHRNVYPYQTATSHNWINCHASPQCVPISDSHFTQLKRLPCITAMCTHIRRPLHTIKAIVMHHRNVYSYQTATWFNWSDCHAAPQCVPISDGHFTQLKRLPCITAMCTHIRRPLHTIEAIAMHHRNVYPYQTATSHNWSDCQKFNAVDYLQHPMTLT